MLEAWFHRVLIFGCRAAPAATESPVGVSGRQRQGRSVCRVLAADSALHLCWRHLPVGESFFLGLILNPLSNAFLCQGPSLLSPCEEITVQVYVLHKINKNRKPHTIEINSFVILTVITAPEFR